MIFSMAQGEEADVVAHDVVNCILVRTNLSASLSIVAA